ncbi:MAG: thioesterase family protein [Cloacibacillus sp.]
MKNDSHEIISDFELALAMRVRYSETDQMKVVYNANYLDWFEVTRTELCRKWGAAYTEWEEKGIILPVVEAYCRYKHPARYDDEIELWGRITELKVHSVKFEYRIKRAPDGLLLAEGWTKQACADAEGRLLKKEHGFYLWLNAELEKRAKAAK